MESTTHPQDGMISLQEAITKLDKTLTMVPMKMQEEVEQLAEARVLLMNVIRVYENEFVKKDQTIRDAQAYIKGLEDLLVKTDAKLELPEKPVSLKVVTPKIDPPK